MDKRKTGGWSYEEVSDLAEKKKIDSFLKIKSR